MSVSEVRRLFAYDEWANARLLRTLEALGTEQLTAAAPSSFSSLQATMAHIVSAEWVWLGAGWATARRARRRGPRGARSTSCAACCRTSRRSARHSWPA